MYFEHDADAVADVARGLGIHLRGRGSAASHLRQLRGRRMMHLRYAPTLSGQKTGWLMIHDVVW